MEWPRLVGVVGESDRVDEAIHAIVTLAKIAPKLFDLIFELDIANEQGGVTNELLHLLAACLVSNCVNDLRTGVDEHSADMPGYAFAIGDTHHQDALAIKL